MQPHHHPTVISVGTDRRRLTAAVAAVVVSAALGATAATTLDTDPAPLDAHTWLVMTPTVLRDLDGALWADTREPDVLVVAAGNPPTVESIRLGAVVAAWDHLVGDDHVDAAVTWRGCCGHRGIVARLERPSYVHQFDQDLLQIPYAAVDTGLWNGEADVGDGLRTLPGSLVVIPVPADRMADPALRCRTRGNLNLTTGTYRHIYNNGNPAQSATIDWGDGTLERLEAGGDQAQHRYPLDEHGEATFTYQMTGGCYASGLLRFETPPSLPGPPDLDAAPHEHSLGGAGNHP